MTPPSPASPDGSISGDLTAINRAILDTALDCIITMNRKGIVTEFNSAAQRVFGYARAEAVGRELAELIVPPALRASHRRGLAHYLATGEGPVLGHRIEINALRRDGSEILVELAITAFQIEGEPVFTAYLRDITERVRTEKRRAAQYAVASLLAGTWSLAEVGVPLLEAMAASGDWAFAGLWLHDEAAESLHCATTWHKPEEELASFATSSRSFQFQKGEGLPGRVWATKKATWVADVTEDANFPRAPIALKANLRGGFAFPLCVDNRVNGVIEMFSRTPVQPDDDLLQLVEAIGIQIGLFIERRRIEQELKREKESAESANAAKDRFLAMLSHELRTPLTPVLIWAGGTINEPNISPEIREGLKMICRNVELEARLIDDMLDLTRITRGKLKLQLGPADVHDLVRHALEIVRSDLEGRQLKLSISLTAADRQAMVDAPRLQQVFWNVFRNACKFTSQNGDVTVRSYNSDRHTIVVEISDNGIGIAPEFIDKVFDAFEQGDMRREGLGLGLAISKPIVEMHGGTIEARSAGIGHGATFVITLPLSGSDQDGRA
jgi:two-component system cell cycle sensor histidine kinase/response regulator CckA